MAQVMPNPTIWLADQPREMLEILHKAAKDVAREEFRELFENEAYLEVYVRIIDLPIADSLRDIRSASSSFSKTQCSKALQVLSDASPGPAGHLYR